MGISKGNSIIFVIHLSIEFLFLQQILPWFKMKSISILIFAALIMLGAADLPDGGDKASVKGCCVEAGVPNHCIGLCTPGQSVARSLGNRITSCTEYDEDIEKCWEQSIPTPDKIEKSEPPVPVEEVKPVTKGQFLLIELPDSNASNATQSRICSCCCNSSCCYDPLNCCCTGC